jgi:hypothetical protein
MNISFLVPLDNQAWDKSLGGWRCDALRIPSARVEQVFANGKQLDPASYRAEASHAVIRWGKASQPPSQVSVSIVIDAALSTEGAKQFWKRLAVVMPLVTLLAGALISHWIPSSAPTPTPSPNGVIPTMFTLWGTVDLKRGGATLDYTKIQLCLRPPELYVDPDGSLKGEVTLDLDRNNNPIHPPRLLVYSGLEGYDPAVVHFFGKNQKAPINVDDYGVKLTDDKYISLGKLITFRPSPARWENRPYAQETQQAIPVKSGEPSGSASAPGSRP